MMEQQQQTLGPLRHQSTRDGAVLPDNSPGYVGQNRAQAAQQPYGGGDSTACFQYEDFAGMLGERFLSGSLSDVSASASDKVYSGYSSSGEHPGQRVKLMCSFGGKILPRPGDGKLRYAGGDTRIISVHRHIKYGELLQRMARLYGQPVLSKYQLPNEDLDALISISCDEDVENMMEEYDRLQASEGSSRLRIFLFSLTDHDLVLIDGAADRNTDQSYMNAINGMLETRPVSMVPLSSSNIVTGQQLPDILSASRILNNSSYAIPVVSNPQFASSVGLSAPMGMLQQQLLSKIGPPVSPPTPPSPTISSQLSQLRQPGTSNAFLPLYSDHVLKGPTTQIHEQLRIDSGYQDDIGAGSGTSSLNSQQDGHYRHFDAPRLIDSPTKAQYEAMLDHAHHQEQFLMAESMHPKSSLSSGISHPDSYGRLPRMGSDRSLTAVQQQQPAISGPVGRPSDVTQFSMDLQNLTTHDQGYPPQSAWQHPRQEVLQRLRPVRLSAPENMQGLAVASQQLRVSPYPSPVVLPSHEVAAYNQLDQSGVMSGFLFQKAPAVQTSIQSLGTGQFYTQQGSAPSSPRVKFQDMSPNYSANHPVFVGHAGFDGRLGEPLAQPQVEPVLRGLKPLNTRPNPHEQLLFVDDPAARQQLLSPLSMQQETHGGPSQQEGDHSQGLYLDGLIQSRTPPYPGGSPYSERLTAFSDQRVVQGGGQEQMQHDDSFSVYSNHQEGFERTVKKPQSEKTSLGWSGVGQVDFKGESSMPVTVSKATETSPASIAQESSFAYPSSGGVTYIDSHVSSGINFMPAATPQTNLDGLKFPNVSMYLQMPSDFPLGDTNLVGASAENQLMNLAPFPAANISGNVDSLFEADLKEGRWVKGVPAEARPFEKSDRLLVEQTHEIKDSPFLGGRLGRQAGDKDTCSSPDEPFRLSDAEQSNVAVNRNKPNDTFYAHMQLPTSLGTSNLADQGSRQNFPSSPRISAGILPLGSHSLSRPVEASVGGSCLSEVVKDYNCGDFVSFIPTDDLELPRSEFAFSNNDRPIDTQYVSLATASQAANSADAKDDFPIFDSESVEANEFKDVGSNKAPASAEIDLLPSSLYSAPTLSMQNWETSLDTTRTEDLLVEKHQDVSDHIELHAVENEVLEVKGEKPLDDTDGNNVKTNPAAMAEAEAVSRGLQTIKNEDLEELQELGTGTFGTVFHGKWRGTDVAIKRIKSSCFSGKLSERDRLIADFWKEAFILGQLHHPNVVAFYGVVPDGPGGTLATVTEYMVNGSLKQVLHKKDRTIDRRKRLLIIMDAAFGMEYLHGKNIVHFDLKCENLLVNMKDPHRPICKVGDLGLSKVKQQTMVSGGVRGTLPWMAPELLNGSSDLVSEKVDVYSFGIVMWELLTGEEPYAKMHYGAIIGGIVNNTLRPPIPSWCDPSWKALMEKCWSADPLERPAFVEISAELRNMANSKSLGHISGPPN